MNAKKDPYACRQYRELNDAVAAALSALLIYVAYVKIDKRSPLRKRILIVRAD